MFHIGIKTISPASLNRISIRLSYAAKYWDERKFDPGIHTYHRYELLIEDELSRKQKTICHIVARNGNPDISHLQELFAELLEVAVFDEYKRIEMLPSDKELLASI